MKYNLRYKHRIFIIIFWVILSVTIWSQMIQELSFGLAAIEAFLILISSVVIAHTLSDILLPKALSKGTMRSFVLQCIGMTLLLAMMLGIIGMFFTRFQVQSSTETLFFVNSNLKLFLFRFCVSIPSALLINGTACGLRFYQEHSKMEKNHARLQQAHLEAQIRILQDQINPHLMFNVLNHIHILMQKNVDLASVLLIKFSDILRYQLYECNQEFVSLGREIGYLKDLIAVEQIRWGEELLVDCTWEIKDAKRIIVPLLLVPLIENAFKHVSRLPNERGYVVLKCTQDENVLTLEVRNSFTDQFIRRDKSHGLGLENVKKRLNIQYPDQHELIINKTDNEFKIILTLQLA
ncbi:sensor histidine kinase [Flavobacterium sp. '19STA2R22 D10 B1']|uniref:sensor histidine kinase n=1 Tax=Flavobacterium aerium TaxID=3037261 RepID=UPI00278C577C|nr:histidine kinase [Flavobacterium sp. '19STA2R22 D10 B1']